MGIPRFYRYMSERYPLLNQPVSDVSLLPEFDCFYLDMNGIIHNCTHTDSADDDMSTLALSAQLHNIFTYIDRLVTHIIKPKQLVYLAIDGVAPRAKLNQQRSRRFRAGLEREEALEKEREQRHQQITLEDEKNGHRTVSEPTNRFDSNCITPGTEFLSELSQHLIWFVRYKMKTDPLWQRLEVYFSGSEVPGEGEHKIVEFIRHRKMAPGYQANMRHCMYGSDADLMLLGLMTHEPHFTLVREVVVWGGGKGRTPDRVSAKKIGEEQWQLVHLSLFREYIMLEMRVAEPLDGERMLDDFILLTYLLGNDFIPHSPTLEISEDAIPRLLRVYRELLERHGGQYLTENGNLVNVQLLQELFTTIGAMEEEILSDRAIEEERRSRKNRGRGGGPSRPKPVVMEDVDEGDVAFAVNLLNHDEDDQVPGLIGEEDEDEDDDIGVLSELRELVGSVGFQDTKWAYYERKFGISRGDGDARNAELTRVKMHYMEALVWCLQYYFQGPPSWAWYYPYHYAPMVSDLTDIVPLLAKVSFKTDDGDEDANGPLLPFEQLMANLPATSAHLVPAPYRFLMQSPLSPIHHFYPTKFEIDMEGKRNAWEGVNLLPFIDAKLLKEAIAQYCPENQLTAKEIERNQLQKLPLRIVYDPSVYDKLPSTMPGVPGFPDIASCGTRVSPFAVPAMPEGGFQSKLMPGVTLPMAGFPSLYTVPLASVRIEKIGLNCFGMMSRKATLVLQLGSSADDTANNPQEILGQTALVNWPNLHEARVVGVSTLSGEYRLNDAGTSVTFSPFDHPHKTQWAQYAQSEVVKLLSGRGVPGSGGIDLSPSGISCVLHVLPLQGMVSDPATGGVTKRFGTAEALVPHQLAVMNRELQDERYAETKSAEHMPTLKERFPPGSTALITNGQWLGCTATVEEEQRLEEENKVCVRVRTVDMEPPFGYVIAQQLPDRFLPGFTVARKLGISPTTLGLLTGSVVIKPGGYEIGLNVRFRKELLLPGYCRLVTRSPTSSPNEKNVWERGDIVEIVGSGVSLDPAQRQNGNNSYNTQSSSTSSSWEYTERTAAVLAAYKAQFPEIFRNLDKQGFATSYQAKDVFGVGMDKAAQDQHAQKVVAWLDAQKMGKKEHSKHIPISSEYVSLTAMRAMEAAGMLRAKERASKSVEEEVAAAVDAADLFRPNPLVNQDLTGSVIAAQATLNGGAPLLGDRVINISARGVPFAQRGTVVATHVSSQCVEVLFDEGFTGGEPLYGSVSIDRGKIVPWTNVMCVSTPSGDQPQRQRSSRGAASQKPRQKEQNQPKQKLLQPNQMRISSNGKAPQRRKEPEPPVIVAPVPTPPPVQPRAEPMAPPDPAKITKLIKKWSHKDGPAHSNAETSSRVSETPETKEDTGMVPSVAALFSAAAAEAAEAQNTANLQTSSTTGVDLLAGLFPHMATSSSTSGAGVPPPPMAPPMPPQPMMMPAPPQYMPGYHTPYGTPAPPHMYAPQQFINPYHASPPLPPPSASADGYSSTAASTAETAPIQATPQQKSGGNQRRPGGRGRGRGRGAGSADATGDAGAPARGNTPRGQSSKSRASESTPSPASQGATTAAKKPNLLLPSQVRRSQKPNAS